ncbi:MAG: response regulator [Nitrospinales bacterium]
MTLENSDISAETILIVDDSFANVELLSQILGNEGYRIISATNGKQALEMVVELKPDIILLDIMMPIMDGFETCKVLKSKKNTADIPVIFISAKIRQEDIVKGFDVGGSDYITKPIQIRELLARVRTHLRIQSLNIQKKQSEQLLIRFGRILEDSFSEIYIFHATTLKFLQANSGAQHNLGYDMDELGQRTAYDLKPGISKEAFEELLVPLRTNKEQVITFESTHTRKDKTTYPVSVRLQLMGNESPPVFLGIVNDISERKLAEDRLLKYSLELERSNRELTDFASIAAHDLNDPLRKVITFSDRLRDANEDLNEKSLDYIERMQKATGKMQNLISDLLEFSSVTLGAKPFQKHDLTKIGRESLHNLETIIENSQGKVEIADLPSVEVDSSQILQLFQNLISNSLKYRREGVAPVVKIHSPFASTNTIDIIFEDNGIGFDEKYMEKIFQPFQRLHGKSAYEGTGMGLAICKKIVQRHNGTIMANSVLGEGSTFIVTLPINQNNHKPQK